MPPANPAIANARTRYDVRMPDKRPGRRPDIGAPRAARRARGYLELFERTRDSIIKPGCGACIGCGPGVSDRPDQVTVSAINRNYKGRSGPGRLYLASPLTVAASAVTGEIVEYEAGMFDKPGKP